MSDFRAPQPSQAVSIVSQTEAALNESQIELEQAEIAAIEATARAESARDAHTRLKAAVAALKGETPAEPSGPDETGPLPVNLPNEEKVPDPGTNIPDSASRDETANMTPEEFDAYRKRRQRQRKKELDAQNPLAQYKCGGCGAIGTSTEQIIQAPSGAPVRLIGCSKCGNQTF